MPNPVDQLRSPLRSIKTFEDLVRYLEDELDWPLQAYDFEDLTFEYSPAELGLKDEDAAKVKAIRQLRPMVHGQPFGIFFVEFERKRMPVVVLRRILSHLVLKKRASANRAGVAAWDLDDLLFISAFGDAASDQREIAFAHFWADPESPGDLPVLKVLGWDDGDTILHVAQAEKSLREHLRWPDDVTDLRAWRSQWASAFTLRHREVIQTATQLVEELARLATAVRRRMNAILASESEQGPIRRLHADFRKTLIHDLSDDDFADVVAQTITYGLLAARFSRPAGISVHDLPRMVPPTNPFLRDLLEMFLEATGHTETLNFDELGIQDVVEVLNLANADAVKVDFGNRTRSEDPVVHFYEHFLKAYDARRKVQRGVFYTPQPVVSYIVRSVHELLQTEFGIEDGLASTVTWGEMAARARGQGPEDRRQEADGGFRIPDGVSPNAPFVVVLDPATGTGTFLVEVIEVIFRTLMEKWTRQRLSPAQRAAAWNAYVPEHLFPRLFGYELMMAPYAIAHMKLGLKLSEINTRLGQPDYQFKFAGRAHIYLTNALEPPQDFRDQFAFVAPALAHEAQAVNAIKRGQRFTVVIGNPPYAYASANTGTWVTQLVAEYFRVDGSLIGERNSRGLQDDYVKFFRFAQYQIENAGAGVLGFITNHGYLSNPTFRGMRQSLIKSFGLLYMCDLHGNAKKEERALDGSKDENVFDIMQGVAICLGLRKNWVISDHSKVFRADIFGSRAAKYGELSQSSLTALAWNKIIPSNPFYLFVPHLGDLETEYNVGTPINEVFRTGSVGISTSRDSLCIAFSFGEMLDKVKEFSALPSEVARERFDLGPDVTEWSIKLAQNDLLESGVQETLVYPIFYRPFDTRYTYYTGNSRGFHSRPRPESMRHLLSGTNLAFCSNRQVNNQFRHVFATRHIADGNAVSLATRERTYEFPLYLSGTGIQMSLEGENLISNLDSEFLRALTSKLYRTSDVALGQTSHVTPEDVFHYIYAIFHAPAYRTRYAEFLKIDFPRVPLTSSLDLFRGLAALGGELVGLHLMESPALAHHITTYAGPAAPQVEKVTYADGAVWVNKAQTAGFRGVPEAVWNFHIGGYQVCDKWLKDRKGRTLSAEDIEHYQRVVVALHETIRIMGEIDAVIEAHGGWPIR